MYAHDPTMYVFAKSFANDSTTYDSIAINAPISC